MDAADQAAASSTPSASAEPEGNDLGSAKKEDTIEGEFTEKA